MTKDDVKAILEDETTKHDAYYSTMIPILTEFAEDRCHTTFSEPLPGGVRLFIAKACEYNLQRVGLESRTMDNVSYSYTTDFPKSLLKYLKPYRKVRLP